MPATNSSHYVPRLLMNAWRSSPNAVGAWVADLITDTVTERAFDDLCCLQADKAINDLWNALVEHPATKSVKTLRHMPVAAPNPIALEEVKGLAPISVDALFHLFWALRARSPDTPPAWGGLSEAEYVALLQDPAESQALLADLQGKYRMILLSLGTDAAPLLALGDGTVFPLRPVGRRAAFCLPISPTRALLMADKRIALPDLQQSIAAVNLGQLSHGSPNTLVCLAPSALLSDPSERLIALVKVKEAKLKWTPEIVGRWAREVDLET